MYAHVCKHVAIDDNGCVNFLLSFRESAGAKKAENFFIDQMNVRSKIILISYCLNLQISKIEKSATLIMFQSTMNNINLLWNLLGC